MAEIDSHKVTVPETASPAVLDELVRAGVGVHQLSDFVAVWGSSASIVRVVFRCRYLGFGGSADGYGGAGSAAV